MVQAAAGVDYAAVADLATVGNPGGFCDQGGKFQLRIFAETRNNRLFVAGGGQGDHHLVVLAVSQPGDGAQHRATEQGASMGAGVVIEKARYSPLQSVDLRIGSDVLPDFSCADDDGFFHWLTQLIVESPIGRRFAT